MTVPPNHLFPAPACLKSEFLPYEEETNGYIMATAQERYDEAMFDFSQANYSGCIEKLARLLVDHPDNFDAQLALGMAHYRNGNYAVAIAEGHKAEQLRPKEQLVHTNLSLFYMKAGDKQKAEHHGLQARIAGWRENMTAPAPGVGADPDLQFAQPKPPPMKAPPPRDMPWKKKPPTGGSASAPPPVDSTAPESKAHPGDSSA